MADDLSPIYILINEASSPTVVAQAIYGAMRRMSDAQHNDLKAHASVVIPVSQSFLVEIIAEAVLNDDHLSTSHQDETFGLKPLVAIIGPSTGVAPRLADVAMGVALGAIDPEEARG